MADNEKKDKGYTSLSEKIKASEAEDVKKIPKEENPMVWHKVIMSAVIALTGLILLAAIVVHHLNGKQVVELNNQSVVKSVGSRVLPAGDYYIYRVFLDPNLVTHYVVASLSGGALVSVVPPDNTAEPENIIAITKYDSAAYVIRVDENGGWSFLPTSVLKGILERQGVIASDAEYRAKFNIEENKPSAQSVQGNTGTAANNSSQGQ